jgi:hypothetical protein
LVPPLPPLGEGARQVFLAASYTFRLMLSPVHAGSRRQLRKWRAKRSEEDPATAGRRLLPLRDLAATD